MISNRSQALQVQHGGNTMKVTGSLWDLPKLIETGLLRVFGELSMTHLCLTPRKLAILSSMWWNITTRESLKPMTLSPLRTKESVPPSETSSMTDSSSRIQSSSNNLSKTCKKRPHSLESSCKMLSKKLLTRLKKISMRSLRRKIWILSIELRKLSSMVFIRTEDQAKESRVRTRLLLSSRPKTSSTKRLTPTSRPLARNISNK